MEQQPTYQQQQPPMQQQPMQQQPMQQQQVVVVQQPTMQTNGFNRGGQQAWTTGLCGCFEDIGTCCIGYFCPIFLACQVATQMKESCFVPLCIQGGTIAMRTKLRTVFNIEGSICYDFCATSCCGPLALCQMAREMKNRGV